MRLQWRRRSFVWTGAGGVPLIAFFFYCYPHHRDLHSFPTRRSSDLAVSPDLAPTSPPGGSSSTRAVSFLRPCRSSRAPRLHGATIPREGGRSSAAPKGHRRPSAVSWPRAPFMEVYLELPTCGAPSPLPRKTQISKRPGGPEVERPSLASPELRLWSETGDGPKSLRGESGTDRGSQP